MALAETAELVAELSLKGNFRKEAALAGRSVTDLDKKVAKLRTDGLEKLRKGAHKSFTSLVSNAAKLTGALAVAGGVAFKWAADFEEQLDTINTVAKVTPERLGAIGDSIKEMAEDTGTSLDDLTGAYYDLVSAGVKAADAQGILTQANKLAIGGLSTTGEAVDLLTTAINVYGAEAKDAQRITDGFAQAIADGKVKASELADSFADVAPFAKDLGIEIEELQAGYALLTSKGIKASQASTYMRSAIAALLNPTAELERLQSELNVDFAQMAEDRGLVFAYNELRRAADKAGIPMQKLTGRIEGAAFASNVAGRNFKAYNAQLERIRRSSEGAGTAAQQMAERQKGVNAQLRMLKRTAQIAAMELTEGLLPGANKGFRTLKNLIQGRKKDIRELGATIGRLGDEFFSESWVQGEDQGSMVRVASPFERAVKGVAKAIGEFPFEDVKSALSTGLAVVKEAARIFDGLPDPIKQGLITLLAVNKLTGGGASMIAGGLKDLAGFVLKSLQTINAANVTVIGRTVTGVGGGGAGGGGRGGTGTGGGGILGGLGSSLIGQVIGGILMGGVGTQQDSFTVDDPVLQDLMRDNPRMQEALVRWNQRIAENTGETKANTLSTADFLKATNAKLQEQKEAARGQAQAAQARLRELARLDNEAGRIARQQLAKQALALNAAHRTIPLLGQVRSAVGGVQQAIARKDLSVRVSVTTNVSAVTSEQTNHFVNHTSRVVAF